MGQPVLAHAHQAKVSSHSCLHLAEPRWNGRNGWNFTALQTLETALCAGHCVLYDLLYCLSTRKLIGHAAKHMHSGVVNMVCQHRVARLVDQGSHRHTARKTNLWHRILTMLDSEDLGMNSLSESSRKSSVSNPWPSEKVRC